MEYEIRYDLPWNTWRALHSGFVDFALRVPAPLQDSLAIRVGGDFSFERFMLAIHHAHVLNVVTLINDLDVAMGIAIPVSDGPDWTLFTLDHRHHGVTVESLMSAGRMRIDEQLDALLNL